MHEDWVRWAIAQDTITSGEKLVLMMLAAHADNEARATMRQSDIAKRTGIHLRTVGRHLAGLQHAGLILYESRSGPHVPTAYLLVGDTPYVM